MTYALGASVSRRVVRRPVVPALRPKAPTVLLRRASVQLPGGRVVQHVVPFTHSLLERRAAERGVFYGGSELGFSLKPPKKVRKFLKKAAKVVLPVAAIAGAALIPGVAPALLAAGKAVGGAALAAGKFVGGGIAGKFVKQAAARLPVKALQAAAGDTAFVPMPTPAPTVIERAAEEIFRQVATGPANVPPAAPAPSYSAPPSPISTASQPQPFSDAAGAARPPGVSPPPAGAAPTARAAMPGWVVPALIGGGVLMLARQRGR